MSVLTTFDISGKTGVAWGTEQHRAPVMTLWRLPDGDRGLCVLRQQAVALFEVTKTTHVGIEDTMHRIDRWHGADVLIRLKSLEAVVREAAFRHGTPAEMVEPRTWRKTFIGKGGLERDVAKRLAMQRCRQLGWNYLDDDNCAEAAGLWFYKAARLWPKWSP